MQLLTRTLVLSFFVFISACGGEEEPLTLEEGSFVNEFHQTHAETILFQTRRIPLEDYTDNRIARTIEFTEGDELSLVLLLAKTQTYYLHQLAPELEVNDLCKKGSYQFTFIVDGQSIFTENVQTGAGSCWFRNSATNPMVLLITEDEHWGKYLWTKFMKKGGGQKALAGGPHQLKIEVRPYIETDELKVGDIIAEGEVQFNFNEKKVTEAEIAIQNIAPTEDWELSTQSYDQETIRALNKKIAQGYFKKITSIVVAKDGQLLLEEYFNGANRSDLHDTRSVGKSLAGTVLGIAINEGHITGESAQLKDFYNLKKYKNPSPEKEATTLKELLTMTSGFAGNDMDMNSPGNEENMYPTDDWVKFTLDLPMRVDTAQPGWHYFTAGVVVLGDILNQKVPGGLEAYAAEKLFAPLGISQYQWQYTPQSVPNTAGGFQMNALDLAKYGQLYVNNGKFNEVQVVPAEWINSSLSPQVTLPSPLEGKYGYLFWNKTYTIKDQPVDAYYASGNGGNKIVMLKDLNVVIVITATAYNQPYMHIQVDEMLEDYLLPAVMEVE